MKRRLFLSTWITPVVSAVVLPAHAQTTHIGFLDYDFVVSNRACDDVNNPHTASFTICNNGDFTALIETIKITVIGEPDINSGISTNPILPVTISSGSCVDFTIENTSATFSCGNGSILLEGHYSEIKAEGVFSFNLS